MQFDYKKSLGQNFIRDNSITDKIVMAADIDKDTLIIEIGPGAGALSKKIIPLAGAAILYEIDTRLQIVLEEELHEFNNYEIIFNDVLKQDINKDIHKYNYQKTYVVANLPYYITTPIITKLIKEIMPNKIVVMVQEEVANRLCATAGTKEYGMISVLLGSKYDIKKEFRVDRSKFKPAPNVDSMVISMIRHDKYIINNYELFEKFIKDAFKYKRKNLKNNISNYDINKIEKILKDNNFSLSNRAEELPISLFVKIANNL